MNKLVKITLSTFTISELLLAGGQINKPVETFKVLENVEKKSIDKELKHFHEPFCVCNKSPLFSKHKYDGKIHGYLRVHHIFDGKDNGFDKNTGSSFGFGLKYNRHIIGGFSGGVEYYGVTDTGLTDTDNISGIAYGQFMNAKKDSELEYGDSWGAHLSYKADNFRAILARSQFDSPLTKMQITHVPNLFEYARVDTNLMDTDLSLAYITGMSYGSRSAADFGLIGEFTGTGGMVLNPFKDVERGKYYKISDIMDNDTTEGVLVFGMKRRFETFRIEAWDFYIKDILNDLYLEAEYPFYDNKGYAAGLHFQYLYQDVDEKYDAEYGGGFYGVKLSTKIKKLKLNIAYNKKDDGGGILNPSGANPGYTSSIFSRNEYRSDVSAYKISLLYPIMKNLKIIASYANYGQSNMTLKQKDKLALVSQRDADETNIVLVYKPMKNLTFKLFNAQRTSEFSTKDNERKQNQTRLIVNYNF
jgi:hypothetical protein